MHIPKTLTSSKWKTYACMCGNQKTCLEIVKQFRELDDIRAQYKKVPIYKEGTRNTELQATIDLWRKRMCVHLMIDQTFLSNQLSFKRCLPTNDGDGSKKERDAYITMWHFHPKILEFQKDVYFNANKRSNIVLQKLTMKTEVLKELGLYNPTGGNYYSKTDTIKKSLVQLGVSK